MLVGGHSGFIILTAWEENLLSSLVVLVQMLLYPFRMAGGSTDYERDVIGPLQCWRVCRHSSVGRCLERRGELHQ